MLIRSIVTPVSDLMTVSSQDMVKKAFDLIVDKGFLSIPVVDEKKFVGFLSKQYIYDKFFESKEENLNAFLQKPVSQFISEKIDTVSEDLAIEEAADLFANNQIRFIPVADSYGHFVGIVTQKSLFKIITKIYGLHDPKIVILMDDFKGMLAKLADIISKNGANIVNIAHIDTGVMNLQEVSVRVECDDLDKLVENLKDKGYNVKEVVK